MAITPKRSRRSLLSIQIITGAVLIAFWWPIAWLQVRPISDYYFFPLWMGYVLIVDGLVKKRTGTSLITRGRRKFALLFLCSIPFWWIFEWLNGYLGNWKYKTPDHFSMVAYILLASLAFSTVVPAVLEMTELVASFGIGERLPQLPPWKLSWKGVLAFELLGWAMFALVIIFPHYAFALAWLSLFFIIEPFNSWGGQRSIGYFVGEGNWAALWNIMLATVTTGFFWEMWNFHSMPKWTYDVPLLGFFHVFEMPILGYTGYIPFGLEVFAIFALVFLIVFRRAQHYAIVNQVTNDQQVVTRSVSEAGYADDVQDVA